MKFLKLFKLFKKKNETPIQKSRKIQLKIILKGFKKK